MSPKAKDLKIEDFHQISHYELIEVPKDGYCLLWSFFVILKIQLNWNIHIPNGENYLDNIIVWFFKKLGKVAENLICENIGVGSLPQDLTFLFKEKILDTEGYGIEFCESMPTEINDKKVYIYSHEGHFSPLIPMKYMKKLKPNTIKFLDRLEICIQKFKKWKKKREDRDRRLASELSKTIGCLCF